MKLRKYILLLFLFLSYLPVLAQVDTAWVRRYNGPGNDEDYASALAVDSSGNVYVTGFSIGTIFPDFDYATIKYAANGDTLWIRRYNGPGNDFDYAYALATDGNGNVYVTGGSTDSSTFIGDFDYATIKYAPNGDTLWVRRYNGPANYNDEPYALAVDGSGNVYVTGGSWSETNYDYATIKYAANGATLWVSSYSGEGNGNDEAYALAADGNGNVYVTGWSEGSGTYYDYATIRYAANGDTLWVRRYNGPANYNDKANALAVDGSGNVYVTGGSWSETNYDYATIKYAANGATLWVRRYNGPGNSDDRAYALAVDRSGNVYVTGYSSQNSIEPFNQDIATIKYAPNGDTLWVRRYNGQSNGADYAWALAVDGSGNVYVTGERDEGGTFSDYVTIKYAANGDTLWVRDYNGLGNNDDAAFALAVDALSNVYVAGGSYGSGTNYDYATIKYVQCLAKPGDLTGDGNILLPDIVKLINYLFKSQPAPNPLCRGDANADGTVLLPDIVYLINFLFKSGPAPLKSKECCL